MRYVMLTAKERVQYTVEAIQSVKERAKEALAAGDNGTYFEVMVDLMALEVVLVGEAEALIKELNSKGTVVRLPTALRLVASNE